ncbi:MAG: hypothetical protein R3B09_25295 [Nannocystaceae bacterium]
MPAPVSVPQDAPVTPLRAWRGRARGGLPGWSLALALAGVLVGGCTRRGQTETRAPDDAVSFRDGPLLGAQERLPDDPAASAASRVARLDRPASSTSSTPRFGDDDGACESLWVGLRGCPRARRRCHL